MPGDQVVSLVVCLSLLTGLVVGLRFNVRMLAWACLFAIVTGSALAASGVIGIGRDILMTTMAVVALQVGYFVALVIGAMRLTEAPIPVREAEPALDPRHETPRATRA